jgi:dolichyl-phosphate-mannose-protein mannosyltransferase
MAGFGYLISANHFVIDWTMIGNALPGPALALRIIPALAGTLLPLVIYGICRRLNFWKTGAMTAALLVCLENSLVVQSRFILSDIVMLLFGFTAILCYLEYNHRFGSKQRSWFLIFSIMLSGAALSIKWTGLSFILLIILLEAYRLNEKRLEKMLDWKKLIQKLVAFSFLSGAVCLFIYMVLFGIHFSLLTKSGPGDDFMSPEFQKTLANSKYADTPGLPAENYLQKFTELNGEMLAADKTLTAPHQYSSTWNTWPLMARPIFYWQEQNSYIYLLGNPLIYLFGLISILAVIGSGILMLIRKNYRNAYEDRKLPIFFLAMGFLVNYIPFIFIGRVMFLYHYEAALVFAIMAIAFLIDTIQGGRKYAAALLVLILALILFVFFSPLTYGTPLSDSQLQARMWFPTWR